MTRANRELKRAARLGMALGCFLREGQKSWSCRCVGCEAGHPLSLSKPYARHVPDPASLLRCTSSSSHAHPINMYISCASRVHVHALAQSCLALPSPLPFSCQSHKPPNHPFTPFNGQICSLKQRRPAPGRSSRSETPTQPNHRPAHHLSSGLALPPTRALLTRACPVPCLC